MELADRCIGVKSSAQKQIFLYFEDSKPAMEHTRPPNHWVSRYFPREYRWQAINVNTLSKYFPPEYSGKAINVNIHFKYFPAEYSWKVGNVTTQVTSRGNTTDKPLW